MAYKLFFVVAFVGLVSQAMGNSAGAPTDACENMIPQHGVDPQTGAFPYSIDVSRNAIRAGDEVMVTVSGKTSTNTIKGFMVQARQGNKRVGEFIIADSDKTAQIVNCEPGKKNAATHRKIDGDANQKIVLKWKAPENFKGEIQFRATVALNGGVFWVDQPSNTVRIH